MKTFEVVERLKESQRDLSFKEFDFRDEITLEVKSEQHLDVLSYFKKNGFEVLMDLTGVDYLEPEIGTKIVYLLHSPSDFQRIRIALFVPREGVVSSATHLWEGADWYERELYDLFGVHFEGHPDLKRILMPDNWIGHPLQKDYPLTEEPVSFKHGVKPKVPSEIIHVTRKQKNIHE